MQQGFSIQSYKGMFTVEYSDLSVGMTLLVTHDEQAAQAELDRWQAMSPDEAKAALMNRPDKGGDKRPTGQRAMGVVR